MTSKSYKTLAATTILIVGAAVAGYILYAKHKAEQSRLAAIVEAARLEAIEDQKSFRIAVITDIDHCPSREAANMDHIAQFLRGAAADRADMVVSLGDNASHRLRNCSETADMDARFIVNALRATSIPTYFVLGDHDLASSVLSYTNWLGTIGRDRTYYSFDDEGVHVAVLDTVLGGDPMSPPCSERADCRALEDRLALLKSGPYAKYKAAYPESKTTAVAEKAVLKKSLDTLQATIDLTRSSGTRDEGRIGETQLAWLEADLRATPNTRIVLLTDHPLFPFKGPNKAYNIGNGEKVRALLESLRQNGKQIVVIGGEAHLWHEEVLNGIQHYIVSEFRQDGGSWAYFSWSADGYKLEQIRH